jgi:hypothetical protein
MGKILAGLSNLCLYGNGGWAFLQLKDDRYANTQEANKIRGHPRANEEKSGRK